VLSSSTGAVGDAATATGQLHRDDGCVHLAAVDRRRWLTVFPADRTWVDGALVNGGSPHSSEEPVT
jgi:hypothetical protein